MDDERTPDLVIPDHIIDRIRDGRCALIVGSSFGALAGMPGWKKLLERLRWMLSERAAAGDSEAADDVGNLLKKGRLLPAANFLVRTLGSPALQSVLGEEWKSPEKLPAPARLLGGLPIKAVWTTHPGDLVDRAVNAGSPEDWPQARVASYETAGDLDTRKRYVLKLLGDLSRDKSYALESSAVRRNVAPAVAYRAILQDLYRHGTLVFIGFRFGDPDLHTLLDRVFATFEPPEAGGDRVPGGQHYFVGGGIGPVDAEELRAEHHISVLNIDAAQTEKAGGDHVKDSLSGFLGALMVACAKSGLTLATHRPAVDDLEGWCALLAENPDDLDAQAALTNMERIARDAGDGERLADIMLARVEVEPSHLTRAAMLRELARSFETTLGDLPRAFTALTAALRENPADDEIVAEAERLAAGTDGWGELIADLSEVIPHIEDKLVAASHWTRLGRWYHEKLRHDDYAVASYREALKLDPTRLDARAALAELYRRQQKWGELAEELSAHADVETDSEKKSELLLTLGDLQESSLGSTSRATEAYEKVLAVDAAHDDALAALERLYRRGEHWGRLASVLERRAALLDLTDTSRAASLRRELAALRSEKLGDVEGAIARWESALKTHSDDVEAFRALEKLYEKVGRFEDALRMLERLAERGPESERPAMWRRLAALVEDREGGATRAIRAYERVLELEPHALDAYRTLERLYRQEQAWESIVKLYERQIAATTTPPQRVELYLGLGRLHEQELLDPHRAIEAYINVIDLDGENKDALAALGRLYKRIEAWDKASAIIVKHAEVLGAAGVRAPDLWHAAGEIHAKHLHDEAGAEMRWAKALEIEAAHIPSLTALLGQAKARKDWGRALGLMLEAERYTQNRLEKVQFLFEAALVCDERLEQKERAVDLYGKVLALDPEHVEAGERLADHYVAAGQWAQAEPILDMLVRKADPADAGETARRATQLARAAEATGNLEKAAKFYGVAAGADSDSLEAALGLANIHVTRAEHQLADRALREVLAKHRPSLAQGQVIDIWHRIGLSARARADASKAEDAFRRALDLDPGHRASLRQVVELATEKGDWRAVVQAKRDSLEGASEEERLKLLEDIADALAEKLSDPVAALTVYLEALSLRPRSYTLLHKILEVYTGEKNWRRAVETLDKLAEIEKDASVRAKYIYASAVIARDEIKSDDEAVERFTRALDDAPTIPKAFEAIERILGDKEDARGLVRAYRLMIKRLGDRATPEQQLSLWTRLGGVALDKMGDVQSALAALEVASALDPTNIARHEQLATLYLSAGPTHTEKAIAELQLLLKKFPDRLEIYRSLSKVYAETLQIDKAWCVAQALMFLGQATPDHQRVFEKLKPKAFTLGKRRITEELWQKSILHPREDRTVNAVFQALMASLAAVTAQPRVALGLNPKDAADVEKDQTPVARVFRYAVQVLGITPQPELYLRPGQQGGLQTANIVEKGMLVPAMIVSEPNVGRKGDADNAFDIGRKLAFFRPEKYVYYALPTVGKIEAAFEAILVACGLAASRRDPDVDRLVAHLKRTVSPSLIEHVTTLLRKHATGTDQSQVTATVSNWVTAVDLTANRVGLILANDLETAARSIAVEKGAQTTLGAKERLRELLSYAASEEYFAVRRHLGLEVETAT